MSGLNRFPILHRGSRCNIDEMGFADNAGSQPIQADSNKKYPEKPERIRIRFPGCYRHLPDSPDCLDFPMHSLCKTPPGQFQDRE